MSKLYLYIAEPRAINEVAVTELVSKHDIEVVAGNGAFDGADQYPYDTLIVRSQVTIKDDIKQFFPNLKNIVRVGTGLDNIDLAFCKTADIAVFNAAGANADSVSEYVVAVALYALRKLNSLTNEDAIEWNRFKFRSYGISEQVIGIIGFGNIGKLVYEKLHTFRPVRFLVYDPFITQDMVQDFDVTMTDLEIVLKQSTVITLHLPLMPQTKHIIGGHNLPLLQDGTILINASRGGIVDEKALIAHTPDHNITYIADTVEDEPHVNPELVSSPNVIITPHIASLTNTSENAMLSEAIRNYLDGNSVEL